MKTNTYPLGVPSGLLRDLRKNLKPLTPEESRRCFAKPDPEFDALAAHCASSPRRPGRLTHKPIGARGLAAVLLLSLVTLPMACLSRTDPALLLKAETTQPKNEEAASGKPDGLEIHTPGGDAVLPVISCDNVLLQDFVRAVARQAELNIQFDPELANPMLNEKWENVTALQALQALLDNHGLQITRTPGSPTLRIGVKDPKAVVPLRTRVNLLDNAQTNAAAAGGNEVFPVVCKGVKLQDFARLLARRAELNIQFEPELANPMVNENWKNVTARQALQAVLDENGLQITQIPGNPILCIGVLKGVNQ